MESDVGNSDETNDAIVLVALRNQFYRQKYHTTLAVHALAWLVIITLGFMIYYIYSHPRSPYYFATDNAGRFIQNIPLQQPNMKTDAVVAWTGKAVEAALSYDYMNFREQLQNAQKYFTDFGWRAYMQGLTDSLNLVALKERDQIVIARIAGPAKIIAEGPLGSLGIFAWKIEYPVLVTYMTPPYDNVPGKSVFQNPLNVTVVVQRQDELSSSAGLGIVQLIAVVQ